MKVVLPNYCRFALRSFLSVLPTARSFSPECRAIPREPFNVTKDTILVDASWHTSNSRKAREYPHPPQMKPENLCDSTLERLGALAQDMYMEEYTRLDLLLGVCHPVTARPTLLTANVADILEEGAGGLEARLADVPLERGMKLRHWMEIVARVHSDFMAKLPDAELPVLVTRAKLEDDRTEESWHWNLMLPEVKG